MRLTFQELDSIECTIDVSKLDSFHFIHFIQTLITEIQKRKIAIQQENINIICLGSICIDLSTFTDVKLYFWNLALMIELNVRIDEAKQKEEVASRIKNFAELSTTEKYVHLRNKLENVQTL